MANFCGSAEGTLGAMVQDQNGNQYILSDAHVLAIGLNGYLARILVRRLLNPMFYYRH